MIITRTPFRASFAGGGSDLPSFYRKHEGCVLSTFINNYMYITVHPSFKREITAIKYSKTENVTDIRQIQHPIARQLLLDYGLSGLEITSTADVPVFQHNLSKIHAAGWKAAFTSDEAVALTVEKVL